jgi:hypothetical protein
MLPGGLLLCSLKPTSGFYSEPPVSSPKNLCETHFNIIMILWLDTRFGLVIWSTELLQLVTTSKDYAVIVLHTSQISIGHTRSSEWVTVLTSCCLVAVSSGGHYPSSGFPNCFRPLLPASHSNCKQQLKPSGCLTNWLLIKTQLSSLYSPGMNRAVTITPLLHPKPSARTAQKIPFFSCLQATA